MMDSRRIRRNRTSGLEESDILNNSGFIPNMISDLRAANLEASLDPQVTTWIIKKKRWLERQLTPFEQYVKKDGEWICLNEHNGIRSIYPDLYKAREKQLKALGIDWLWDFQKDDIIRMSLKNTNLLCWSWDWEKREVSQHWLFSMEQSIT